jgi:uncharacterized membrane protein YvlD (DUF360 family)
MALFITWIANSLSIYAVAYLMAGVDVASLQYAFLAGLGTAVNAIVKPVRFPDAPLTVLTSVSLLRGDGVRLYLASPWFRLILQGSSARSWRQFLSILSAFITRMLSRAAAEPIYGRGDPRL